MAGVYRNSFDDTSNSPETELLGGTDQTKIGNVGDRLKVSAEGDVISTETQGRIRVAENTIVFDAVFMNTDRSSSMYKKETTGGTVTRNSGISAMELKTTTSSGSRAVYQSFYHHYIPGQTFSVGFTGVFGTTHTNCRKRMGYFDDNDGMYLEYDGTELTFNIRNSISGGTSQSVTRTSFNTNTLASFDPTKYYLWQIDYLWQGSGPVSLYVFDGDDRILLHKFAHSGSFTLPYTKTPNLPIRYEAVNVGVTSSAQTLQMFCVQLSSEGRALISNQNRTASNAAQISLNTSTFAPLVSVRLKSTSSRALIALIAAKILVTSLDDVIYQIVKNPTLTGASFSSVSADSIAEADVSATATSGGIILDQGFVSKSGGTPSEVAETFEVIQSDFDGTTTDILTIQAKSLSSAADGYAALTWSELF